MRMREVHRETIFSSLRWCVNKFFLHMNVLNRFVESCLWGRGGPLCSYHSFLRDLQQLPQEEVQARILRVLEFMEQLRLDVATFLYYFSWNLPDVAVDGKLKYARTALMHSELLSKILRNWSQPPRAHTTAGGVRTNGAREALNTWALDIYRLRNACACTRIYNKDIAPRKYQAAACMVSFLHIALRLWLSCTCEFW